MKLNVIRTGSKANSAVLSSNNHKIILDAGAKIQEIKEALGYDFSQVDFSLISHLHTDHSKSLEDLRCSGIEIIRGESHEDSNWIVKSWGVEHDVENYAYLIYDKHTKTKTAFLTDCSYSPLTPICHNLIIEINYVDEKLFGKKGELNERYLRLKKHHMSLSRCKELIAEMLKVTEPILKNIVVTHMSKTNSDAEQIKRELFELTGIMPILAEDGMEIEL